MTCLEAQNIPAATPVTLASCEGGDILQKMRRPENARHLHHLSTTCLYCNVNAFQCMGPEKSYSIDGKNT